ncbi:MAG TPA: ATP-binding cassette domain-containing protein [bacterium]|nr:ATP-binding cassette domain-containing protein [bacterium]
MLELKELCVSIQDKEILKDISLTIPDGETHVLFGPNGSGKTSLLLAILGYPQFKITKGEIIFNGKRVDSMAVDERARMGMGVFFQRPPVIKGMKLNDVLKAVAKKNGSGMDINKSTEALNLSYLAERDINAGYSGGEIKRSELSQMFAQKPSFLMLDEPESGVDIENMKLIGKKIRMLLERDIEKEKRMRSSLIITHTGYILDYVDADMGYSLINGSIKCRKHAGRLFEHIQKFGFKECELCQDTA